MDRLAGNLKPIKDYVLHQIEKQVPMKYIDYDKLLTVMNMGMGCIADISELVSFLNFQVYGRKWILRNNSNVYIKKKSNAWNLSQSDLVYIASARFNWNLLSSAGR